MAAGAFELVVAMGDQHYRVERPFGRFDAGNAVVSDVACDSRGHVYVLLRSDPLVDGPRAPIVELAPDGAFVRAFGAGDVLDAHMMAIDASDRLYVVDRDSHQIVIFDRDGAVAGTLGERGRPGRPFAHPSSVALGPDGSVYVGDGYAAHRIHRFSASWQDRTSWGERGSAPGQFSTPHGVWVAGSGTVLVSDRENDRVQIFSAGGEWLAEWKDLPRALDVWSDGKGHIYVSDLAPRLTRFDASGRVTGCCRPVLNGAHGICGDALGNIYLAEVSPSRLTRLSPIM
jgi:peptidylglycine monooxygenase